MKSLSCLILFLCLTLAGGVVKSQPSRTLRSPRRLLYLPLDERFTTRNLFLANAQLTGYQILTPDISLLPRKKSLPDIDKLLAWTKKAATVSDVAVISAEMFGDGGLIASRISTDSLETIGRRLRILEEIKRQNPKLRLLVSSTVTRLPAYPSAEEEPDYYASFGREIFQFSFYSHRYEILKNAADKLAAEDYQRKIPPEILSDFLTRRKRNFEINKELIKLVEKNVIERLVITLDDNAEYGFSKKEAAALENLAVPLGDRISIYAGADEAQLALLSHLVAEKKPVRIYPVYRFPQSRNLIPAFEGAPLSESVERQVAPAGGIIEPNPAKADCILYVNNFEEKETFPPKDETGLPENVEPLEDWLKKSGIDSLAKKILIVADNRFYNGADVEVVAAVFKSRIDPAQIAYAGWNTSGNTLGSAVALGVLRRRMLQNAKNFVEYKELLFARFVEDWTYMTIGREQVRRSLQRANLKDFTDRRVERQNELAMKNLFNRRASIINCFLKSNFTIEQVYFPWHRPFEIGFEIGRRK